jgi:hypothetical protein
MVDRFHIQNHTPKHISTQNYKFNYDFSYFTCSISKRTRFYALRGIHCHRTFAQEF